MNSVISNNLSWKCQRFTPSGCKDIGIKRFDLWQRINSLLTSRFSILNNFSGNRFLAYSYLLLKVSIFKFGTFTFCVCLMKYLFSENYWNYRWFQIRCRMLFQGKHFLLLIWIKSCFTFIENKIFILILIYDYKSFSTEFINKQQFYLNKFASLIVF